MGRTHAREDMAKLNAEIGSLDEVPEAAREFYAEHQGAYRLQVDGVEFPDEVAGLRSALEKLKRERNQLREDLKAYEGIEDPEAAVAALEKLNELEEGADPDKVEAIREKYERELAAQQEKMSAKLQRLENGLRQKTVEADLNTAISELGIEDPTLRRAAKALLRDRGPQMIEVDGAFMAVFPEDVKGLPNQTPVTDFVKAWGETDEAKSFLPAKGGGGSGAEGSKNNGAGAGSGVQLRDTVLVADPAKILSGEQTVTT